jgi:hypothetical protein
VNEKFGGEYPVLSPEASVEAALRLYRKAMGRSFTGKVKLTSGNRRTWVRNGVMSVNPDEHIWTGSRGLREIIHSISHLAHMRLHPLDAPHSRRQAQLEGRLVTYAIKSGWMEPGKLKPTKKTLARLSKTKETKRKPVDPDLRDLRKLLKKHGLKGRVVRDTDWTDYVIEPTEKFPKGIQTCHYDWSETLDRIEEALEHPDHLDEQGWLSR